VGGQHHAPTALPPGKTRYPLYRILGGPQGRSGRVRKISCPPEFDPRTTYNNISTINSLRLSPLHITSDGCAGTLDFICTFYTWIKDIYFYSAVLRTQQQVPGGYFNETTQVLALAVQNADISDFCIGKSTVVHMHAIKEYRRSGGIVLFIINLVLERRVWSSSRPTALLPNSKPLYPFSMRLRVPQTEFRKPKNLKRLFCINFHKQ
jgi:hypothetical protein